MSDQEQRLLVAPSGTGLPANGVKHLLRGGFGSQGIAQLVRSPQRDGGLLSPKRWRHQDARMASHAMVQPDGHAMRLPMTVPRELAHRIVSRCFTRLRVRVTPQDQGLRCQSSHPHRFGSNKCPWPGWTPAQPRSQAKAMTMGLRVHGSSLGAVDPSLGRPTAAKTAASATPAPTATPSDPAASQRCKSMSEHPTSCRN
jgi:hypothetical protein